jgi:C1A family cysteine protease
MIKMITNYRWTLGFMNWLLLLFLLLMVGCSGSQSSNDQGQLDQEQATQDQLPDDAYSATLPLNATLISSQEFSERLESGDIYLASLLTQSDQDTQLLEMEARDDETIADFRAANPGRTLPFLNFPASDDETLTPLENGSYIHTIQLNNGTEASVVTMSQKYIKHQFADAIRTFPTWENQLKMYRSFYAQLPADWRGTLELVNPETIESNPEKYSAADIVSLNERISENAQRIIASFIPSTFPEGYVSDPTLEIGYYDGSDSFNSDYDGNPGCGFQPKGIRNAYEWPMKYYVTSVKDQHNRGTCVAFANTSAIETHVAKKYGFWTNLSEQDLYNRMKLIWQRGDFGDGFTSDLGFSQMAAEQWLLPFEDQWPYNPSIDRLDGTKLCTQSSCENNSESFRTCASDCGTKFAVGSTNYNECVNEDCRKNSTSYQACKNVCDKDPNNHHYYFSCQNYADTCSDSTHQSELVCKESKTINDTAYYTCAYEIPEKNSNNYGYRITSAAQIWNRENTESIEFSFATLLLALHFGNPVVIGHPVTTAFDDASDDGFMAYVANDTNRGGHGLHAVGYIDNKDLADILPTTQPGAGGGYVIVKNSWSNCWGDGGYVYIPYQSIKEYTTDANVLHGVQ